ncbi:MAG: DUF4215 domain-containing protein [Nannocystaceae bacterium]|nr:DUF4215 domain-containing protein [Nannocystaceae bacterium]
MDRMIWVAGVLLLGACTSFVGAETSGAETETTSSDETGQSSIPIDTSNSNPTSATGSGDPATTTGPSTDPTTTGDTTLDPTAGETSTGEGESSAENSTGPESTDDSSTDDSSTDDSSTGEPEADCGDGVSEGDEDCDDENSDELDGCTSNCVSGPTGIDFGAAVGSGLAGGGGLEGTIDNTEECPPEEVLVGLQGNLTDDPWLGTMGGICRPAALTNTDPPVFATGGPPTELPEYGQVSTDDDWSTECDDDEAIVAVQGGAGTVIDGIRIQCAQIDTVGAAGAYSLQPTPNVQFEELQGGPGGGSFGPLQCPAGSVAAGLRTVTNSFVIQVELRCRELDLTY